MSSRCCLVFYAVPLYLVVFLFIDQLNNLTMVTSIGMMRNQKALRKTFVYIRTKKLLSALKMLQMMALRVESIYSTKLGAQQPGSDLSPARIKELRRAFDESDTDGNGVLTGDEMKAAMRHLGVRDDQKSMLSIDSSWSLSFEDFVAIISRAQKQMLTLNHDPSKQSKTKVGYIENLVDDVFRLLDRNNTGSISTQNFVGLLCDSSQKNQIEHSTAMMVLREADTDGDGEIQKRELQDLLLKYAGS